MAASRWDFEETKPWNGQRGKIIMAIHFISGDLLAAQDVDAIAHGCNCAGAMGKGIALAIRRRWPEMYQEYRQHCRDGKFRLGDVFVWESKPLVFNLGTQQSYRS